MSDWKEAENTQWLPHDSDIRTSEPPRGKSADWVDHRSRGASIEGDVFNIDTAKQRRSLEAGQGADAIKTPIRTKMRTWWRGFIMGGPRE